jgi:large subunit ribosomal protein L16
MKNQQKMHKGRVRSCLTTDQTLWKGMYAAVANESARITELQIKAAELAIKRVIQKNGVLWMRINPGITVSKKPAEVRMGKGKGSIHHYIARVSPGSILFELNATNEILARQAFKIAASKWPIQTKFVVSNPL